MPKYLKLSCLIKENYAILDENRSVLGRLKSALPSLRAGIRLIIHSIAFLQKKGNSMHTVVLMYISVCVCV